MDNVTHTLFALTLARTPLGRAGRGTTAALVLASNAPDIDIVSTAAGGGVSYMEWHRGPTHGPLGIIGLGLVVAIVVWLVCGRGKIARHDQTPDASLSTLAAISMLGVLFHILMDVPTSYGTRLLSPFDWHWYAADWLPIVDIYLLAALGAALWFGRGSPDARRRNAALALGLMAANYGVRGVAHHQALTLAPQLLAAALPPSCEGSASRSANVERWPSNPPSPGRDPAARPCLVELAAMPTFLSPFRWRLIAHLTNAYEVQDIDLLDARFRTPAEASEAFLRTSLRVPDVWTHPVDKAATTRTARIFLGFARFPAARASVDQEGTATVRWTDVRFVGGTLFVDQPAARTTPFTVTIRLDASGEIREQLSR